MPSTREKVEAVHKVTAIGEMDLLNKSARTELMLGSVLAAK
jgi:hypothetical protein